MTDIQKIAYEKYRLQWMLTHGYSLTDLINQIQEYNHDYADNTSDNLIAAFNDWEYDIGFNGELWACFDEFYCSEYQDEDYVKALLSAAEWELYLEDKEL